MNTETFTQSDRAEHLMYQESADALITDDHPDKLKPIVRLINADKIYYKPDGSILVTALDKINLDFYQGEYAAIMGASGSGKSTLLNILGCLDRLTNGNYILDEADTANLSDLELSRIRGRKIGFVFQAFNLISELTVLENVEVPLFYQGMIRHKRRKVALEKLDLVGLSDRLTHRPSELSGGQQQRVAIARSLVNDPAVILADEPTGNLDSITGNAILETFDKLHRDGMTVLMVTHDLAIAHRAERSVILKDGHIDSDIVSRRTGILASNNK